MHSSFVSYLNYGKSLASAHSLDWDMELDDDGKTKEGWNLTEIVGSPGTSFYLRDFGPDNKSLKIINAERVKLSKSPLSIVALSKNWQDLIKSVTCEQLFVNRNSVGHINSNIIRPIKVLATCCKGLEPWTINVDILKVTLKVANEIQKSGKLADVIAGIVRNIIDANNLSESCPLYLTLEYKRITSTRNRIAKSQKSKKQLLSDLKQRKNEQKLPEIKAFWELIRIVFTEEPHGFLDALRFSIIKVMIICGLRIGEAVLLPLDWKREREYFDSKGQSADKSGGFAKALILRHFAEKQQLANSDSSILTESTQFIPSIFEETLTESLETIEKITAPLRQTLKMQSETSRLLPWYNRDDLISVAKAYTHLSGNPIWLDISDEKVVNYTKEYKENFDPSILGSLYEFQEYLYNSTDSIKNLNPSMYVYLNRIQNDKNTKKKLTFRTSNGEEYPSQRKMWREVYFQVGELEDHLNITKPSKVSDTKAYKTESGILQPWKLLFLFPKRSLNEERNGGITDVNKYYSVGAPNTDLITHALGSSDKKDCVSLFQRYGKTEEDRNLSLNSHSLRHLQNTELFRLGVADTIITKRFNRKSVAQSYEYDHRSLSEELDAIEIPENVEISLGENSSTVAKMIKLGKANGPIIDNFKSIQTEQGDEAAFEYLRVEADGFHATPYGHCINSFTVDPCPKNLECFSGCRHLTATDLPENRRNLEKLEQKLNAALLDIESRPKSTIGRENQLSHAKVRLKGVRALLNTAPGVQVFPKGKDLSKPKYLTSKSVLND